MSFGSENKPESKWNSLAGAILGNDENSKERFTAVINQLQTKKKNRLKLESFKAYQNSGITETIKYLRENMNKERTKSEAMKFGIIKSNRSSGRRSDLVPTYVPVNTHSRKKQSKEYQINSSSEKVN